jgi:hypothetical protein
MSQMGHFRPTQPVVHAGRCLLRPESGLAAGPKHPTIFLRRWPLSKRVNSSMAPADDPTLIGTHPAKATTIVVVDLGGFAATLFELFA